MEEYLEELTFLKEAGFDTKSYYIFLNTNGDHRITESGNYISLGLQPGMILQARIRKKGCAGREITELIRTATTE